MTAAYVVVLTWMHLPGALAFAIVFSTLHNMYVHLDLPITHGRFKYCLASPVFHPWHHADVPEAHGKNLANRFPIWDKLFGTYIEPGLCNAPMGALKSGVEDKNPFLIMIYPLREWARMIHEGVTGKPRKGTERAVVTPAE